MLKRAMCGADLPRKMKPLRTKHCSVFTYRIIERFHQKQRFAVDWRPQENYRRRPPQVSVALRHVLPRINFVLTHIWWSCTK